MSNDAQLSALLRESRTAPALPPRFQENVWRRIEAGDPSARAVPGGSWLETLTALLLRPRFALAAAVALVFAGALLGVREGGQTARHEAQARYLASVAPSSVADQ